MDFTDLTSQSAFVATVSPSDELSSWMLPTSLVLWFGSSALAVLALTGSMAFRSSRWRTRMMWLALIAIILSLGPMVFSVYVYAIDYVPVEIDGTRPSPPWWEALAHTAVPLVISFAAIVVTVARLSQVQDNDRLSLEGLEY